jgi:metal-sulfur cluster biosynthetic enzyme
VISLVPTADKSIVAQSLHSSQPHGSTRSVFCRCPQIAQSAFCGITRVESALRAITRLSVGRPGRAPSSTMDNANPTVHSSAAVLREEDELLREEDEGVDDRIDALEIFEHIRHINDPEHPHSLEELKVARLEDVDVADDGTVTINFTPTVPHCSMATLIGLCIRVKLLRSLPEALKVDIYVAPGSHASEHAVNKQLNDKERVAAALENDKLLEVVNGCLMGSAITPRAGS